MGASLTDQSQPILTEPIPAVAPHETCQLPPLSQSFPPASSCSDAPVPVLADDPAFHSDPGPLEPTIPGLELDALPGVLQDDWYHFWSGVPVDV